MSGQFQSLTGLIVGFAIYVDVVNVAERLERGIDLQDGDQEIAAKWLQIERPAAGAGVVVVKPTQRFCDLLVALGAAETGGEVVSWSARAERLRQIRGSGTQQAEDFIVHAASQSATRAAGNSGGVS